MKKFFKKLDLHLLIVFTILVISFWFRIQGTLYGTFAFTYDVGRDLLAISQMISEQKPLLIGATTGLQGIFYGPTWYYLLTPFFVLFGGNPTGIAFVMVLCGVLTVYLGYILGKKISDIFLGIVIALFIALSQVLTEISAQIWNPNPIPLFVIISLILMGKIIKNKISEINFFWFGLVTGIIFDLELVFGVLYLIASIIYILLPGFKNKSYKSLIFLGFGFIIIQVPRIIFEFRHDFLMTRTLLGAISSSNGDSLFLFVPKLYRTIDTFFQVFKNTVAWQSSGLAIIFIILFFLIIFKTYKSFSKIEQKILGYVLTILGIFIVGLSFFNHDIESHYYIGIPILYILLIAFSIYSAKKYLKLNSLIIIVSIIFFSASLNQLKLLETFKKSDWIGDASVYRNQVEVVDYIYEDAKVQPFNTITYTPPIFDYPYQYLFLWKGKKDYGYLPSKENQELFYLIIEPDNQFPIRLEEWLKLREDDGEIINEKVFKSGIRVQKRIH